MDVTKPYGFIGFGATPSGRRGTSGPPASAEEEQEGVAGAQVGSSQLEKRRGSRASRETR